VQYEEPTVGQLVASVTRDMSSLVRSEIELAKAEVKSEVTSAVKGGGMLGAAGFLGVVAFILLSIAAAYGLTALGMHPGWAFLIVAVVYLLVAGLIAFVGVKALKSIKPPERSIRAAKETAALVTSEGRAEAAHS
jgi:membrane protein implicated in regulation of membrane protease activity